MNNYVTNDNAVTLMSAIGNKIKDTKITATANSEDITLTDAADARIHDLKIYGKTENGTSVGENGLTVTVMGKNLFNINGNVNMRHQPYRDGDYVYSNGWTQDSVNRNTVSGNVLNAYYDSAIEWGNGQVINVKEGKTYTISFVPISLGTGEKIACVRVEIAPSGGQDSYDAFMLVKKYVDVQAVNKKISFSVTIPNGITQILVAFFAQDGRNAQFTDIQVEKGASATEYEPYYSNAIEITTALPLRRKMLTVDLGDYDWYFDNNVPTDSGAIMSRFGSRTMVPNLFDPTTYIPGNVISDVYLVANESCSSRYTASTSAGAHDPATDKTFVVSRKGAIYIIDHDYTDPAEFKAAVTGITLTYPSYCDEIDLADGVAITRLDSNGDVLATPVTTPLSDAEKAAFAELRTFEGTTNVTATDNPFMSLLYVKNTDNGKALANVDDRIKETDISGKVDKVAGKGLSTEDYTTAEKTKLASLSPITISSTLTLTVAGWDSQTKQQTVLTTIDTTKRNVIDITVSELPTWSECNVYAISESATGVTFQCDTIPSDALTFKITSMVVTSNA